MELYLTRDTESWALWSGRPRFHDKSGVWEEAPGCDHNVLLNLCSVPVTDDACFGIRVPMNGIRCVKLVECGKESEA